MYMLGCHHELGCPELIITYLPGDNIQKLFFCEIFVAPDTQNTKMFWLHISYYLITLVSNIWNILSPSFQSPVL